MKARGIVPDIASDIETARKKIRDFLSRALEIEPSASRDPFKGLFAFDEQDESVFFGRDSGRQAVDKVLWLCTAGDAVPFFGVVGGSGVGKSSFLRAGLIAALKNDTSKGSFRSCIVRPGDLLEISESQFLADETLP